MINVSTKCKRLIYSGERVYIVDATIELSNGTVLYPSNSQIMSDGLELDDAVGSDDDFNCIGSTIVNGCNLILYNNDRVFSDYDFINAVVTIEIKIDVSDTNTPQYETIQKGVFTVDEATWGDGTVTLVLLDNMCQFDRPYTSHNIYTATTTIYDVVLDACTKCGVTIAGTMTNMPNKNFVVAGPPKDDTTYREVIGWCAAIAGCFARCTTDGKLEFAWFDVDKFTADTGTDGGIFDEGTPYYTSGDTVLGGTFNPWNDQYNVDGGQFTDNSGIHHISALTSQNIGVDDVVITDVQIAYEVETANSSETVYYPATIADNRYVISIDAIPFIDANNVEDFYDILADRLIGLTFRTCNVTQINDPTIEAGDIAWLWDTRGEVHKILITRTTFSITGSQTIICGAKTPARNSATQMTAIAKANARSNRRLNEEKSIRQQLADNFNNYVTNAKGLYLSKITDSTTQAVTIYGHDKPQLTQSKMVLKISNGAISMTADYKGTDAATSAANAWFGFQFDGTWLANIISTVNLFFNYAHGGTLRLGGAGNGRGQLAISDDNDDPIGSWTNNGISLSKGAIHGPSITLGGKNGNNNDNGVLTVNGADGNPVGTWSVSGIHVYKGEISGTSLVAGGSADGSIEVKNASGSTIGSWDKTGLNVSVGEISANAIHGGSLTLGGLNNENGRLYVKAANGTDTVVAMGQGGLQVYAGTIKGPKIIVGGGGNNDDGTITVTNSSGATIGTWDNSGLKVSVGEISGNVIKTGRITDANENVIINLNTGALTMKNGSININSGVFKVTTQGALTATSADITGKITSQKTVGSDTLKLIIDDSDLKGYENSTLFGHLDLCAQSSDGQPHVSLESRKYLHLESVTSISFEIGGTGATGVEKAVINSTGLHVTSGNLDVYNNAEIAGNLVVGGGLTVNGTVNINFGGSNTPRIYMPANVDAGGNPSGWYAYKVVDGILYDY